MSIADVIFMATVIKFAFTEVCFLSRVLLMGLYIFFLSKLLYKGWQIILTLSVPLNYEKRYIKTEVHIMSIRLFLGQ